ncbi:MAG: radical SAM protein [Rhodospirillales bacterium]|nr:radical SAM protein [Rhodospirillales bacterium]
MFKLNDLLQPLRQRRRAEPVPAAPDSVDVIAPPHAITRRSYAPCRFQGYADERSAQHVNGWVWNLADADERVEIEAVLAGTNEVLDRTCADQFRWGLADMGIGDGLHAYYIRFPRALTDAELDQMEIRCVRDGHVLELSPYLTREYNPINFVAMDIVDNCNLRCPFCLYDYANTRTTNFMNQETLAAALRFVPYTTNGNFWFSCLHEPTLHPKLTEYIDQVPADLRRKLFYTTNLAKRMPPAYFAWLAESGMSHINISIESLEPALYERMRKGARHRIFMENWDKLIPALQAGSNPPRLRYITMAYQSNLRELPALVKHLHEERLAWQVELRYSFDVAHMPAAFKREEFLQPRDWLWLRNELRDYTADQLLLNLPPGLDLPPAGSNSIPQILTETAEIPPPSAGEEWPAAELPNDDGPADPPASNAPADAQALLGQPINFNFPELSAESRAKYMRGRYEFQLAANGVLRVSRAASNHKDGDHSDGLLLTTHIRNIEDPEEFIRSLPL